MRAHALLLWPLILFPSVEFGATGRFTGVLTLAALIAYKGCIESWVAFVVIFCIAKIFFSVRDIIKSLHNMERF